MHCYRLHNCRLLVPVPIRWRHATRHKSDASKIVSSHKFQAWVVKLHCLQHMDKRSSLTIPANYKHSAYLAHFYPVIYAKDVVEYCSFIRVYWIHTFALMTERAWNLVLSQSLISLVEVATILAYPPPILLWLLCSQGLPLPLYHYWWLIFAILMTLAHTQIHFAIVSLYLGQSVALFVSQRLRETQQIATHLSRYPWQVVRGGASLGEDRIKDVKIKTG